MDDPFSSYNLANVPFEISQDPIASDPKADPFRKVVDPVMRMRLRKALLELVESHDTELARYVSDGALSLESYQEYAELLARSIRDTMASKEGVAYLLESCGFEVDAESINLQPVTRWRVTRDE
ncbi:MAG: hypothetical protein RLZZ142_1256 [Verrucomicrobiota bacterium]|jgi:hypothetical protein